MDQIPHLRVAPWSHTIPSRNYQKRSFRIAIVDQKLCGIQMLISRLHIRKLTDILPWPEGGSIKQLYKSTHGNLFGSETTSFNGFCLFLVINSFQILLRFTYMLKFSNFKSNLIFDILSKKNGRISINLVSHYHLEKQCALSMVKKILSSTEW